MKNIRKSIGIAGAIAGLAATCLGHYILANREGYVALSNKPVYRRAMELKDARDALVKIEPEFSEYLEEINARFSAATNNSEYLDISRKMVEDSRKLGVGLVSAMGGSVLVGLGIPLVLRRRDE